MGIASFIIGLVNAIGACISWIPLLGWGNWIVCPVSLLGVIFGIIGLSKKEGTKVWAGIGLALNLLSLISAVIRLIISFLGGGFGIG